MKKSLLILMSAVFVLAGCTEEAPDKPLAEAPPEQVTENVSVDVTDGIQTIQSAATDTISAAADVIRPEAEQKTEEPRAQTARNSLDWEGPYFGTLPCADCTGIATTLTLNFDGTYKYQQVYVGAKNGEEYNSTGEFVWNAKGDTITLSEKDDSQQFFVAKNALMMLDQDGNKVEGPLANAYTLVLQE
ncbi:copper resistance protein NlpE [Vibrio taketomensis]|uniref:copper resistance protein NlpE n=1 Tax=Vibrio taketomensis TaxID=2572923 RepID=UPI001389A7A0|nr:copper resistance protein NlpE [Vibrio taketomensis]